MNSLGSQDCACEHDEDKHDDKTGRLRTESRMCIRLIHEVTPPTGVSL